MLVEKVIKSLRTMQFEEGPYESKRLVTLKESTNTYKQFGIQFEKSNDEKPEETVNLYTEGFKTRTDTLSEEDIIRTTFKVFQTGDPFSLISPETKIRNQHVTIHVGLEHPSYSPSVLMHEALQLCRAAFEQGAKSLRIAIPENLHPLLQLNDFNFLLMELFKVSGANDIYYYNKDYKGKIGVAASDESLNLDSEIDGQNSHHQIGLQAIHQFLHTDSSLTDLSLGKQIEHKTRRKILTDAWKKFDPRLQNTVAEIANEGPTIMVPRPSSKDKKHYIFYSESCAEFVRALHQEGNVEYYPIQGKSIHAHIPDVEIANAIVTIVQSTRPNPDNLLACKDYETNGNSDRFFESLIVARQALLQGAETINLINPYQFGARSDRAENNNKGMTGSYVQQNGMLLEAAGVRQVITAECHDTHTLSGSYTRENIRGQMIPAISLMVKHVALDWLSKTDESSDSQLRLVTPDLGAAKRTKALTSELMSVIGEKLCKARVLGDKQRTSHADDSARINSLNSGDVGINSNDYYVITDDETATGGTLCQAIKNLTKNGAKKIGVIVAHNNMPLDWLTRQLCLARFLHLGASQVHFSDTQEMGTMAISYDMLVSHYADMTAISHEEVESAVLAWFKKNICDDKENHCEITEGFEQFKTLFSQLTSTITVHHLASEFANRAFIPEQLSPKKIFSESPVKSQTFFSSAMTTPPPVPPDTATLGL